MDILFKTQKLQTICNDTKKRDREYGPERGKKLGLRLEQMRAAENLEEFKQVHSRAHPLREDRKGQWAADLDGPYRVIFEPILELATVAEDSQAEDSQAEKADTPLAWSKIRVVKILEVGVDYHG